VQKKTFKTFKIKNMAKVVNFVENTAINFAKKKTIAAEWLQIISTLAIVRIGTNIVSVYAGYHYVISKAAGFGVAAPAVAVVLLLAIETLTIGTLQRAAKFAAKRRALIAVSAAFFALTLYAISFHISTSGMAAKAAANVDTGAAIAQHHGTELMRINAYYDTQAAQINEAIATEKNNPQGWQGGRRTTLTTEQLSSIKQYNEALRDNETARAAALNSAAIERQTAQQSNESNTTATAANYYAIAAIVMFFQFAATVGIALFFVAIYREIDMQTYTAELIAQTAANSATQARNTMLQDYADTANRLHQAAALAREAGRITDMAPTAPVPVHRTDIPAVGTAGEAAPKLVAVHDERIYDDCKSHTTAESEKLRKCLHCNTEFQYKHWNKQYCSDSCRVAAYESRTGRSLILKPKKS
jgi:hypothetical protein